VVRLTPLTNGGYVGELSLIAKRCRLNLSARAPQHPFGAARFELEREFLPVAPPSRGNNPFARPCRVIEQDHASR
jgi:hypothetical protein